MNREFKKKVLIRSQRYVSRKSKCKWTQFYFEGSVGIFDILIEPAEAWTGKESVGTFLKI